MSTPEEQDIMRTLTLKKPIQFAGEDVKQLAFREPEAELLDVIERARSNKKSQQGESLTVMAWFTRIHPQNLKRL